jgi:predicted homoserine dehydrogenase-like protein
MVAEVLTIAKSDLEPGRKLERIGGRTHLGMIDSAEVGAKLGALPLGLAQGAVVQQPVAKGEVIRYEDVALPQGSLVATLRGLQDAWTAGELAEGDLLDELNGLAIEDNRSSDQRNGRAAALTVSAKS